MLFQWRSCTWVSYISLGKLAFHRDLKLKCVRGKKVDILTKEVNATKKLESNPKIFRHEKGLFVPGSFRLTKGQGP